MTKTEKKVFLFFAKYLEQHGCDPSGTELAAGVGYSMGSNGWLFDILKSLADQGYLERVGRANRKLTDKGRKFLAEHDFVWECPHCGGDVVL